MGKSGNPAKQQKVSDKPVTSDKFLPVKIDSAENARTLAEAEQVAIFELDDVTYSIPKHARAEIGLEYMAKADEEGESQANWYLLQEALGADAVKALRKVKGLTDDQFEGIVVRVQTIIMPEANDPKARRRRG